MHCTDEMYKIRSKQKVLILLCLSIAITTSLASTTEFGLATPENKTLMQPQGIQSMSTNATNIVLVHGGWADASGWNKQIPVLRDAGHKVIAVHLPLHSLSEDVETVKRAVTHIGGPTILVGHSYGGEVITNAAYNNPNVTGLVYVAGWAPDDGESLSSFVDPSKYPKELFLVDSGGFMYINPEIFRENFAQMLIPLRLTLWQLCRNPFINQSSWRSPVLQHGSNYQHGIKSLTPIE